MKLTLIILLLLPFQHSYSQIKVVDSGHKKLIGKTYHGIIGSGCVCFKKENTYIFECSPDTYLYYVSPIIFSFKDVDNAFNSLYNIIIEGFSSKPADNIVVRLSEGYLHIRYFYPYYSYTKSHSNILYVQFGISEYANSNPKRYSVEFMPEQIKKLFGK